MVVEFGEIVIVCVLVEVRKECGESEERLLEQSELGVVFEEEQEDGHDEEVGVDDVYDFEDIDESVDGDQTNLETPVVETEVVVVDFEGVEEGGVDGEDDRGQVAQEVGPDFFQLVSGVATVNVEDHLYVSGLPQVDLQLPQHLAHQARHHLHHLRVHTVHQLHEQRRYLRPLHLLVQILHHQKHQLDRAALHAHLTVVNQLDYLLVDVHLEHALRYHLLYYLNISIFKYLLRIFRSTLHKPLFVALRCHGPNIKLKPSLIFNYYSCPSFSIHFY